MIGKPITNYESYIIYPNGLITRLDKFEHGVQSHYGRPVLYDHTNSGGYRRVTLCKDGKAKKFFLHRLLAIHFLPEIDGKKYVNHINGVRTDNRLQNLEWCTAKENVQDGWRRGRIAYQNGKLGKSKV